MKIRQMEAACGPHAKGSSGHSALRLAFTDLEQWTTEMERALGVDPFAVFPGRSTIAPPPQADLFVEGAFQTYYIYITLPDVKGPLLHNVQSSLTLPFATSKSIIDYGVMPEIHLAAAAGPGETRYFQLRSKYLTSNYNAPVIFGPVNAGTITPVGIGFYTGTLFPDTKPSLGLGDAGSMFYATDFDHLYLWTGTAWVGMGYDGGMLVFRSDAPPTGGWALCDGSTGVRRSTFDGNTELVDLPDSENCFVKSATYSVTPVAAVAPSLTPPDIDLNALRGFLQHGHYLGPFDATEGFEGSGYWYFAEPVDTLSEAGIISLIDYMAYQFNHNHFSWDLGANGVDGLDAIPFYANYNSIPYEDVFVDAGVFSSSGYFVDCEEEFGCAPVIVAPFEPPNAYSVPSDGQTDYVRVGSYYYTREDLALPDVQVWLYGATGFAVYSDGTSTTPTVGGSVGDEGEPRHITAPLYMRL